MERPLGPGGRSGLPSRIPFAEYLEVVRRHPAVADLSHRRIARMLEQQWGDDGPCARTLYGLEQPLREIRDFFLAAGQGLEIRRRILLLMGPVGGGKSSIVELLKRGLEEFSRTPAGALYAIEGCPLREEPLHLVPEADRPLRMAELGVRIEGDLCPLCALRLREEFSGDPAAVPVARSSIEERLRAGIGTFAPSDPKSQDIAELTGSLDFSAIGRYGSESDPRAFRFDGELDVASRGLMEFVELLKCDERFLYTLLTLAQEGRFKTGRYAMLYADEAVVAHSNEAEYRAFAANPRNEALQDRIVVVRVPYSLRLRDEVRIYRRLLAGVSAHIAPHTLEAAAAFAVLTRLSESCRGIGRLQKLRIYDGEDGGEAEDLRREDPDEGMRGVSPRYVVNRLGIALARPGCACLGPIAALRALEEGLRLHPAIVPDDVEGYRNLLHVVREDYDEQVEAEVFPLFAAAFGTQADDIFQGYLAAVERYLEAPGQDGTGGREQDEAMMRAIEEAAAIAESQKRSFREEVHLRSAALLRRGARFDYAGHPALRRGVERRLFGEVRGFVARAARGGVQDPRLGALREELVRLHGYCPECAEGVLQYVAALPPR